MRPLQSGMSATARPYVWLALAGAWVVLAATCLTLAMLLLTWSHSRRHEAGVRLALGASPRQLVIRSLLESMLLCGVGMVVTVPAALLLPYVLGIVGMIQAARAAHRGEYYRYPMSLRLVH